MEYGLIFHGMRIVKYYCKNMKYRINIYILNIQPFRVEYRNIFIVPKVVIFPEAEGNILYRGYNICRYFTRKGFEYLVYYIGYSLRETTVSVATYPLTMRSIRGGTLG